MLKKIPQTLLLLPLFFSLSLFSSSAIAVCSLVLSDNINVKSLSRDGFQALSPATRAIVAAEAIAAACANDREFIFAENTYQCVTSGSGSGRVWLDRNLGASKVCAALNENACFGDYYQWGRNKDGHEKFNSARISTRIAYDTTDSANFITNTRNDWALGDNDRALRQARWSAINGSGVCPIGFRVPSATELDNERRSWSDNNTTGAFASPLKWSAAGYRDILGNLRTNINDGYVWSNFASQSRAYALSFNNNSDVSASSRNFRSFGYSVRCIQGALPAQVAPSTITATAYGANIITVGWNAFAFDVNFYEIYRATKAATATASIIASSPINIFTDSGLNADTKYYYWVKACNTAGCSDFSASVSATTEDSAVDIAIACAENKAFAFAGNGYRCVAGNDDTVWLDRNLGADRICTANDDASCFGDFYQWGRNKDGHEKSNADTDPERIAYTTTDNANFITTNNGDWALGDDDGLERQARWSAINGSGVCPIGFRVPSLSELQAAIEELSPPLSGENRDGSDTDYAGFLWSSDIDDNDNSKSLASFFNVGFFIRNITRNRADSFPVRCIQD